MNEKGWLYLFLGVLAVMLFGCLKGISKLHKGMHRFFCSIPQQADDMMQKFCSGMARTAEERNTVVTKINFEIIKKLYNETEDNKTGYLLGVMFEKYAGPVLLSVSAFMLTVVANNDADAFIDFLMRLSPCLLAIFVLGIAFYKTINNRNFVSEEEIYRKNVTYEMWREYMDTHEVKNENNIKETKKKEKIKIFFIKEKWCLLFAIYMVLGIGYLGMQLAPKGYTVPHWLFISVALVVVSIIVGFDYVKKLRQQECLWEKVKVIYNIENDEHCFQAIKEEISIHNNSEKNVQIVRYNLNVVEAAIAKEKATEVLIPIAFSVFAWFIGNENLSLIEMLKEMLGGSLDAFICFFILIMCLLTVVIALDQYPKLLFTEKVVERMREDL